MKTRRVALGLPLLLTLVATCAVAAAWSGIDPLASGGLPRTPPATGGSEGRAVSGASSHGTDTRGTDTRGTDTRGTDTRGTDTRGTDTRSTDTLTILHTNDLHGHLSPEPGGIAGFAAIAGYFDSVRRDRRDVLVLDAGDVISGSPASSLTRGAAPLDVLSLMGYDAITLGNHEYDHGWARVPELVERAVPPVVCANAFAPDGKLLADLPTLVKDVDGVRVGILGLLTERTPRYLVKEGNQGIRFEPVIDAARRLVPELARRADLVLLLTHNGLEEDKALARAVPGIDLIIGGHSHTELRQPVKVGETWVAQASSYGKRVGRIDLTIDLDSGALREVRGGLVAPAELAIPPNPKVAEAVARAEARVSDAVNEVVAVTARDLGKDDIAALIEAMLKEEYGAELVVQNRGGIRGFLARGPITLRALWSVLPFDNTVVRVRIKGAAFGGVLADDCRKRHMDIDPERVYTIGTNSYVTDHSDRFLGPARVDVEDTGRTLRDAMADYLKRKKTITR